MATRRRRVPEEEHDNHERWMVTYADMVTLLMVLFIVMFAMSQVDDEKYAALKEGLSDGFGSSAVVMDGSTSLLDDAGSSAVESLSAEGGQVLTEEEADMAELTPRGRAVVDTIAPVLRRVPDPLQVHGHTNQVPVRPKYYATDWDLSAARSITVLRYLDERQGIDGERLSASAFGHEAPLVDPAKDGSQEVNKRVDIVVLSQLPAEVRELLEEAAEQRGDRT